MSQTFDFRRRLKKKSQKVDVSVEIRFQGGGTLSRTHQVEGGSPGGFQRAGSRRGTQGPMLSDKVIPISSHHRPGSPFSAPSFSF